MYVFDYEEAIHQYIETALWSESCNGTGQHEDCPGEDCDVSLQSLGYSPSDIHSASLSSMILDVENFVNGCMDERNPAFEGMNDGQVGHDFWLTRNHHGGGFWDRGLGEQGDWLTSMAHPYGECSLYVGDDGKVHVS